MQELERDPLFKMHDIHDISKDELRERTMEKVPTYMKIDLYIVVWLTHTFPFFIVP